MREADIGWDGESRTPVDGTRIRCPTTRRHPKMSAVRENIDYRIPRTNASGKLGRFDGPVKKRDIRASRLVFIHGAAACCRRLPGSRKAIAPPVLLH